MDIQLERIVQENPREDKPTPAWAAKNPGIPSNTDHVTQQCIHTYLYSKGNMNDGGIGGIGWWQAANGYTAIALHDLRSPDTKQNYNLLTRNLRECEKHRPGFINEFIDDSLWWGLCCLHVYSLGGDRWFLEKAEGVWRHVVDSGSVCRRGQHKFRDQDMEGGCFWTTKQGEQQINSISTGLFAELSVRLALVDRQQGGDAAHKDSKARDLVGKLLGHRHVSSDKHLEAARTSLRWIFRCRYRREEAVVLDGIMLRQGTTNDWTFTYTTGVAIGVCALLYEGTQEDTYVSLACRLAKAAMQRDSWVSPNGVLTEPGAYGKGRHDPYKNNDAVGFKSVLIRHLGTLYEVIGRTNSSHPETSETAALIKTFIQVNYQSQQERNTNGHNQYGPWWNGPFESPTSHSQMAVLDVMAVAKLVR